MAVNKSLRVSTNMHKLLLVYNLIGLKVSLVEYHHISQNL